MAKYTLPELKGSPKQIAWATNIRDEMMSILPTELVETKTGASWWIDNRDAGRVRSGRRSMLLTLTKQLRNLRRKALS